MQPVHVLLILLAVITTPNLVQGDGAAQKINYQHQFTALLQRLGDPWLELEQNELIPACSNGGRGTHTSSLNVTHIRRHLPMTLPKLDKIGQLCPKHGVMTMLFKNCREALENLGQIFMGASDLDEFLSLVALTRDSDEVNSHLWLMAFMMASASREDMIGFQMPPLVENEPELFIHSHILQEARHPRSACKQQQKGRRPMLDLPYNETGTGINPEHRLAYFREDVSVNSHHHIWHTLWPPAVPTWAFGVAGNGRRERAGEIFYHMHHEVLARYDTERMSNGLERTQPLEIDWEGAIVENGYFPKMVISDLLGPLAGLPFGGRQDNTTLQNLDFELFDNKIKITFDELMTWVTRIYEAVDLGYVVNPLGERIYLTEKDGMDILGNVIESGYAASPNYDFYGDLHNSVHSVIALAHNPTNRHNEMPGVMIIPATSMRDPAFYKWHKYIDDIYVRHKLTLPHYTAEQLNWSDIQINGVAVKTFDETAEVNKLQTMWSTIDVDLSIGMAATSDLLADEPLLVTLTHLDHQPFFHEIEIQNNGPQTVTGMVRIFMAPRFSQQLQHEEQLKFLEQRDLFFTLDIFNTTLFPGMNKIVRNSTQSTVTIPPLTTFRELLSEKNDPMVSKEKTATKAETGFGCGWPQNMLLPRGSTDGLVFDLFVMVTNSDADDADDDDAEPAATNFINGDGDFGDFEKESEIFEADGQAWAYCGILNSTYPDTKPMGFPFDRSWDGGPDAPSFQFLEEAVALYSNMMTTQIQVIHVQ